MFIFIRVHGISLYRRTYSSRKSLILYYTYYTYVACKSIVSRIKTSARFSIQDRAGSEASFPVFCLPKHAQSPVVPTCFMLIIRSHRKVRLEF
jgi:hypothetical protein